MCMASICKSLLVIMLCAIIEYYRMPLTAVTSELLDSSFALKEWNRLHALVPRSADSPVTSPTDLLTSLCSDYPGITAQYP